MDQRHSRPRHRARTVTADDDRALAEFISSWLARRGLRATPLGGPRQENVGDGRAGGTAREPRGPELPPPTSVPVDPGRRSAFADLTYVLDQPDPDSPIAHLTRDPWVDPLPHLSLGPLDIDTGRHSVRVLNHDVHLTPTEFRLLCYLVEHSDRVVGHRELLLAVWGPGYGEDVHLLQATIRDLRSRIAHVDDCPLIESIYGTGYRMATWPEPGRRAKPFTRRSAEDS